jgi:ABC-type nitrate/sulfonate/bicarbonate transport system substrate-binding protein
MDFVSCALIALLGPAALIDLQEKKLERMRIGGGSATATQMPLWFAKEGCYEKNGLSVEPISIPGSSLALQAMLSGELPIIQVRGAAPIQAHLSGTDTVIIATVVKNFTFRIYGYASINRMEDLKGKIFGVTASAHKPI